MNLLLDLSRILALIRATLKYAVAPSLKRVFLLRRDGQSGAVRLRLALQELGLTYLKLGQYLSTRFDLLPADVCRELNKLLEEVEPVPLAEIHTLIERELNGRLDSYFSHFNETPIAAASVAQVHEAWTRDGGHVAVKVQRPGIERLFEADMRNLSRVAVLVDFFKLLGSLSMREMVETSANWTLRELDFREEGRTADRLRADAVDDVVIPRVYWKLTTSKILTLEFVEGVSVSQLAALIEQGRSRELRGLLPWLDLSRVGHVLATSCLRQLFVTGFFHGDPHSGNILVQEDNKVAFLDFGIFGELSKYQREILSGLIENIAIGNIDRSFHFYAMQAIPSPQTDVRRFEEEGKAVLSRWYETFNDPAASMEDKHLGKFSAEMFDVVRRNHVRMSAETLLFWRAMNVLAATAVRFPEELDLISEMRAFFRQSRSSPWQLLMQSLSDEERLISLARLAVGYADNFYETQYGLAHALQCKIGAAESPENEASETAMYKYLAYGILGLSLVILSNTFVGFGARILLLLALLFFLLPARAMRMR